ncbi:MAG: hypothetical protein ACE5DX_00695 [Candidatus Dojkabacteria bacterium]
MATAEKKDDLVNLALSGWVGVGTSTLTIMLALILKREYYYIGRVMRYLDDLLHEHGPTMSIENERMLQPTVGKTFDKYVDHILTNYSGIIVESDMSAFRIGKHPKVYSIFLKANKTQRNKRAKADKRKGEESLERRDETLQQEYIKLWDVDVFDVELIKRKYNLLIDNSKFSVEQEIDAILERLRQHPKFEVDAKWGQIQKRKEKYLRVYSKKGKAGIKQLLEESKLVVNAENMLREMVQIFPEDVSSYPKEVQKIFLGQK